jgi:hypothetical protein
MARRDIFDDPFHYMIEEVLPGDRIGDQLGGSVNIRAAIAAYEAMLKERSPHTVIRLRERGRNQRTERPETQKAAATHEGSGGVFNPVEAPAARRWWSA